MKKNYKKIKLIRMDINFTRIYIQRENEQVLKTPESYFEKKIMYALNWLQVVNSD